MTQQEFEQRTGLKISEGSFNRVNAIYMNSTLDKDDFCEMWKSTTEKGRNEIDYFLTLVIEGNHQVDLWKDVHKKACETHEKEKIELGKFLADEAHEYCSRKARDKAIEVMGFKVYIAYVLAKGYDLWQIDKEQIIDNLK